MKIRKLQKLIIRIDDEVANDAVTDSVKEIEKLRLQMLWMESF